MAQNPRIEAVLREAQRHFAEEGRHALPWRTTRDPYRILVSEVMLQQTQVGRVMPLYRAFLKKFPTARALARAPRSAVLAAWQGLGYNRRAKFLHEAARDIERMGRFPRTAQELELLPGVGHYTARAVAAFAFDAPEVFVETNIRTAFLHHCYHPRFLQKAGVPDAELLPLVAKALKRSRMAPREFYAALMDYGAHLKRSGVRLNDRSAHYARQATFAGSKRQLRGQIVRLLLCKPLTAAALAVRTKRKQEEVESALARLVEEELISRDGVRYTVSKT